MSLDRVPKRQIGSHLVAIPTTMANPLDVPSFLQLGDDPLNGALRDTYEVSDISHPRLRLPRNAQENVGVVGEKRPCWLWFSGGPSRRPPPCCRFLAPYARCSQWVTSCMQSELAFGSRVRGAQRIREQPESREMAAAFEPVDASGCSGAVRTTPRVSSLLISRSFSAINV